MAGLTWILSLLCVAACHLSSASPVLRSALLVQAGQNASLTCNLTSSSTITWYFLHSDQLQPLLTVTLGKLGVETVEFHSADSRINKQGDLESGQVGLEILEVEQKDAGLYFCTGQCEGGVCVNRGIHLAVDGADGEPARQPCWSLGICVLPALLPLCFVFIAGVYLCTVIDRSTSYTISFSMLFERIKSKIKAFQRIWQYIQPASHQPRTSTSSSFPSKIV